MAVMKFCTNEICILGPFKYYVIKKVGGLGQMLMFAYMVSGWVWQDAYVIDKSLKKINFRIFY